MLLFRSHLPGVTGDNILFVEFNLHMSTENSDAIAPLRNKILDGKLGTFKVVNVFDILEG